MNSSSPRSWLVEIVAVFRKEAVSEMRQKSGVLTAALFAAVAVVAVAFASFGYKITSGFASSSIWITLLFTSTVSVPRIFILEEEQGTGDSLRLSARPHSVFWGKSLFALLQLLIAGALVVSLFFGLTGIPVYGFGELCFGIIGGCAALAGAVSLCGALVSQAANRGVLVAAISLPILLPLIALGTEATRMALEPKGIQGGFEAILGLWGYSVATWALGPHLFAAVWKR